MTIIALFDFTNYRAVKTTDLLWPTLPQGKVTVALGTAVLMDNPMTTDQHCYSLPISPSQHQYCSTEAEIGQK